jgi:hypothetical protein
MQTRDPGFGKPSLDRKGIVAHSTVRFAAGAGVVAASLLIVGPNPAQAVADRHGPGWHSDDDYRKNGASGQAGNAKRPASNWLNDTLRQFGLVGTGNSQTPVIEPPPMNLGSDSAELFVVQSADAPVAMRSAAVAETPAGDNAPAAAPRTGGGYSGRPVTSFHAPRVTIGNGRTPGTHVPGPGPAPEAALVQDSLVAPAAVPPAPAVPAAIEITIPPLPPPLPPVERIRPAELVTGEIGTSTTDTVTDPLAGLAGLILIPAIGAVLGYRQARAAQSLRESLRT